MRTKNLGNTDLDITAIGFGAWAIGGSGWAYTWGPQDDRQSIEAIHKALDLGINWIDTAAVYGLGHSEKIVGQAIKGRRDDVIVATKCGLVWDDNREIDRHLKAESIKKECEDSLRRLDIETIDLYQIHWPNPDEDIEEGWTAVNELKAEGKIRWAGVSNFSVDQLKRAAKIAPVASLQPPYNMLNRSVEGGLLPHCRDNNIGVVAYSPMASGMLTGKYNAGTIAALADEDWRKKYSDNFKSPKLEKNLALIEKLKTLAADEGYTVAELAVAWVLRRPEVTAAIVGARSAKQVEGTYRAGDWELSKDLVTKIKVLIEQN
jgi:aryl-alcohol dehydrogenase-like predicted oxidoreductase